jgi:CHAT domain
VLEYDRLILRIDPAAQGGYDVSAEGSGGDGHERFDLPFHERDLENFVLRMSRGRRGRRRVETPETERARDFGGQLFDAIFAGRVRDVYRNSLAAARREERGLRITLHLTQVPELMDIPWEYLYDAPSFLSISAWTPVVRYLDLPFPHTPLAVKPPLRVLGMVSSPDDCEPLDVEEERARLERSLAPLVADGRVEIDWTEHGSLRSLLRRLHRDTYHVFHYIGHGAYDEAAQDGVVLLEGPSGGSEQVNGSRLGTVLCDHRPLRLAVLNACEGARSGRTDPFAGVATSLVQRELPAVIAMQFEITDEAAIVFSEYFYDALALGYPVDTALANARQGVYADGNDVEWATPVLFLRVPNGRLFDVDWDRARAAEPRMTLRLESEPADPMVDEVVTWRLSVANVGEPALSEVRVMGAHGEELAPAVALDSGESRVLSWADVALPEPEHSVVVEARDADGRSVSETVTARVTHREPPTRVLPPDHTTEETPATARPATPEPATATAATPIPAPPDPATPIPAAPVVEDTPAEVHPTLAPPVRVPETAQAVSSPVYEKAEAAPPPVTEEATPPPPPHPIAEPPPPSRPAPTPPGPSLSSRPAAAGGGVARGFAVELGAAAVGWLVAGLANWSWQLAGTSAVVTAVRDAGLDNHPRSAVFLAVFFAVFTAVYALVAALAERGPHPVRAALVGLALGLLGGVIAGVVRSSLSGNDTPLELALITAGGAVGLARALTARPSLAWRSIVGGLGGGLVAGVLLAAGWDPQFGFEHLRVTISICLAIALGIALARMDWAHAWIRTTNDGRSPGAR